MPLFSYILKILFFSDFSTFERGIGGERRGSREKSDGCWYGAAEMRKQEEGAFKSTKFFASFESNNWSILVLNFNLTSFIVEIEHVFLISSFRKLA